MRRRGSRRRVLWTGSGAQRSHPRPTDSANTSARVKPTTIRAKAAAATCWIFAPRAMPRNCSAAKTEDTMIASGVCQRRVAGNQHRGKFNDHDRLQGDVTDEAQPVDPADDESGERPVGTPYQGVGSSGTWRHCDQFGINNGNTRVKSGQPPPRGRRRPTDW